MNREKKITIGVILFLIISAVSYFLIAPNERMSLIIDSLSIGLSINILSSMILFFLLDSRDNKRIRDEKARTQRIFISRLIRILNDFALFKNLYRATMKNDALDDVYIYKDCDRIYQQILDIDLMTEGYIAYPTGKGVFDYKRLSFLECILQEIQVLHESLDKFLVVYGALLDNEILEYLENITSMKMPPITSQVIKSVKGMKFGRVEGEEKMTSTFLDVIILLKKRYIIIAKLANYLDKVTGENNFVLSKEYLNGNEAPIKGSGISKTEFVHLSELCNKMNRKELDEILNPNNPAGE